MKSAEELAEQAIAKMEQEDESKEEVKVEDKKPEPKLKEDSSSDKKEEVEGKDKPEYDKDGKRLKESSDDEEQEEVEPKKEYTADDALEVDEQPTVPATDNAGIQLNAAEQKHIVDNIGQPLVIQGMRGDKPIELKAYTPADIPKDFVFNNDADRMIAQTGFVRLEQKAEQLLGSYRSSQSVAQTNEFEQRENEGIRTDVAELQKDGVFPKFKIQPGERGFDDDPAAKQVSDVMTIMTERNNQYLAEYQQGRPYKHIGFKEAYDLWERRQDGKKQESDQKKEDQDRKKVADQVGTDRGLTAAKTTAARVKSGVTVQDILNRYEHEEW